jgi:hypothetical protein
MEHTTILLAIGGAIGALLLLAIRAAWWLSAQFAQNRAVTYQTAERIEKRFKKKFKQHEILDSQRFKAIDDRMIAMARDGKE